MKIGILRRRGLGNTSCRAIKQNSKHQIDIIRNDKIPNEQYDLIVRWGTITNINAKKILNETPSINKANNKYISRKLMLDYGVSCPQLTEETPCIIRPHHHSQGKQLYYCTTQQEVEQAKVKLKNYYSSEYIAKDEEWGVFVFNGRVTGMIKKTPKTQTAKNSIAWNVSQGSHVFENIRWDDWNIEVAKQGLKAAAAVGLDFGRVDIMVKDNIPYVLEVNSAHSMTSEYRQQTFTKCLDYFIENGNVKNELNLDECKTYKSIIHPALRENKKGTNL